MHIDFKTFDMGDRDRHDYWREMVCRHHIVVSPEFITSVRFSGQMEIDEWGMLQLSSARCTPITYARGKVELSQADRDDYICVLNQYGQGVFTNNSGSTEFRAGDLIVYDASQNYAIIYPSSSRTVALRIPRPLIEGRVPHLRRQFSLRLDRSRPTAKLAASLLLTLASLDELPDADIREQLSNSLLDVLCLAIRDGSLEAPAPSAGQAVVLRRIKSSLLMQLGDTSLSVETIAAANRVSPRTLGRMFASEGTTVMRWLWQQRLEASYKALYAGTVRQVTEAAFSFGFKDLSHFTKSFKKEYSVSPGKLVR